MSNSVQTPVQIAWVTRDLDRTETMLGALLGAKKWFRMPAVEFAPHSCSYRGRPADFSADISLSYAGEMQLELIRPVRGTSIYTEYLDAAGPGLHHVCIRADNPEQFATLLSESEANGAVTVSRGTMSGGMEFAYVSAPDSGVPFIEIAYIPDVIQVVFDQIKQEQQS